MAERVVLAGASGLIGTELKRVLTQRGTEVHTLVRRPSRSAHEHEWNPSEGLLDPAALRGANAVISLSGASVGKLPWGKRYRETLRSSRVSATRTLARAIESLGADAPEAWLSGSATGFYGSQPGVTLTESGALGDTFLARLCAEWEAEAVAARAHTRVVLLRTAPVIHPDGVLKPMIRLTKLGAGGRLGGGSQVWPWISLTDEVRGIVHALDAGLEGPVNLTGPTPATQTEIGRELARQLRRPYLVPAPEFALRLALGRDATESLLTCDADTRPQALFDSGFAFAHETPADAMQASLG